MEAPTIRQLFDLTGKVALVTGGRNLGYQACEALAEFGATVILTRRDIQDARQTASALTQKANTLATVKGVALDITDEANWQQVVNDIVAEFG